MEKKTTAVKLVTSTSDPVLTNVQCRMGCLNTHKLYQFRGSRTCRSPFGLL